MKITFTRLRKVLVLSMVSCFFAANTFGQTYCTPTYTNLCSSDDFINNFVFNSLTNLNTGCNGNTNNFIYYNSTPTTTVQQGNTYAIGMQAGTISNYAQGFGVWIDYNQDGDFADTGEFVYSSPTADTSLFTGNVIISGTASTGITRLRVRCKYGATVLSTESCSSMTWGETEDYNITITAAAPCTDPPTAGNALSTADSACSGISFTLGLQGNSTGSGQTYQWQSSPDNSSWSNISGATGVTYSTSQTTATYYRCMVTCGTAVASTSYYVKMKPVDQCYCTAVHSVACTTTDNIDTVLIAGTTLNNPGTGCTSGTAQAYTIYPASGNTTATLTQGIAYTLSVTSTDNSIISVWIDYNQDGTFAASEWQQVTTSSTANVAATTSITIPLSSLTGQTRMRVRSRVTGVPNGATDACTSFGSGETEDYTITIVAGSACTNPPTAGTTVSSANPACPGVSFTLSLTGGTSGTGQTYQWQSSADGVSFSNISGATGSTYNASQTDTTFYRCVVTCGASSNSSALQVNMGAFLQCYCDTLLHGTACGTTDNINEVQIISTTLINSNTGCTSGNGQAYTVYPATGNTTATLQQGATYTFSVTSAANSILSVWIDYNQNGLFEASEWTQIATTTIADTPATASITIPISALTGQTGMRVRSRASGSPNAATDACTEFFSGETEDYTLTISAGVACTDPPAAGTANSSDSLICATDSFTLSLTGNSTGTGQTYQWQSSPDNSAWTNIGGATTTYIASQTSANYYRCMVTCGASVPSASVFVNNQVCSCTPTYTNLCSTDDFIDDFSFNTLSKQNSGCNGNTDNYILDTTVTTTVVLGGTYNISMQSGASWPQGFGVWIDYNKNGVFSDAGEFVYSTPTYGTTVFSGAVTIPTGALTGITRLRVRCSYQDTILATESCTNFLYGETEDYNITINNPAPCVDPPTAGMAIVNPGSVCAGGNIFLSLSGNSIGTGQTYQWQSSSDNITFNNITGATTDTFSTSASSATYYRCVVTCGTSANSASVQVTMMTLSAGTASGPSIAIGNQVRTYSLSGSNGNIQWQSSADGITFNDITGATANPQNLLLPGSAVNDTVFLRVKIYGPGCTDVFSNVVITIIDCATPYSNGSSSGDFINNVQLGTINNSSTIDSLGGNVQDFKGTPGGTTNVCKGMSYTMTVSTDTTWTQGKAAWIDFNNNGSYADAGELIFGPTPSSKGAVTDTVLIPLTAVSDTVKMRVVCVYADTPDVNACFIGPYGYGEIEEYSVIINPTPDATITASGPLSFCQGNSLTLTTGTGNSYSWSTGATAQSISVTTAGNYSVTVSNAGNCSSSDTVSVTVNPSPSATATATNAACGANNGSVSVSATGGSSPYSYLWNTGATTVTINGQAAGTYFVTVTDASGCTATASASVNNVGGPSVALSSSNVNCYGGNTGSATAVGSGGTTPYSYNWSNGQTSPNATGLAAGTYSLTLTDNSGCIASSAITITQSPQLLAAPSTTNVSCNSGNNGTAIANAAGGSSPYTYLWSNSQTTTTITGLTAGTYSVTVTDSKSCTANASIIITEPAALSASITSTTNISCNGGNNGNATVSAGGGTGPYSYLWSGGQTTPSVNNLGAGAFSVTVTDNNGCTSTASGTINQPSAIALSISATNAACGIPNGSATVSASGGTGSLSFLWSNGQTNSTATGLAVGTYSVTVTDDNNCSENGSTTVGNANAPSVAVTSTNVTCNGNNDGTAASSVTGGTTPYTYLWSNGSGSASLSGLAAGIYSVTVTGNDGCSASASDTVTSPSAIVSSATSTNVSCNGGNNGSSTISVTGGTSPYSYLWSGGQTTSTATGLQAGNYSVTITDNSGCPDSSSSITITQPPAIVVSINSANPTCGSNNGSVSANASGGTGSLSFLWSSGQTDSTITGLAPGTYSVTVSDINSCSVNSSATLVNAGAPSVTVTSTDVSCNGNNDGTVSASVTGGTTPYSYLWNTSPAQTDSTATGLSAGTYTVTVTGNDGCSASASDTVTSPSAIVSSATSTNVSCNGGNNGSASLTVNGGITPYSYLWSGGQTGSTATGLVAGNYSVTVTDNSGCADSSSFVTISEPSAIVVSATSTNANCGSSNGSATATATGGTGGFIYSWSDGQTNSAATGLAAGSYSVTATDSSGCSNTGTVSVSNSGAPLVTISVSNIFCNGGNNGSATANATGGVTPYSYNWSNGQTGVSANGLTAGTYSVTVSDNSNCITINSAAITEPSALALTTSTTDAACGSSNGSATATVSGGVTPYQYSWSGGQTTPGITGLSAGTYNVTVIDANGCLQSSPVNVSNAGAPAISVASINVNCGGGNDGSATVVANGGATPYTYLWSNGQSTATASGLIEGTYSVTVSDAVNCNSIGSATISATNPAPAVDLGADTVSCGSISLNAGSGFSSYLWSDGSNTQTISVSNSAVYYVTVTDANGCNNSDSVTVTINAAIPVDLGPDTVICLETDSNFVINAGGGFSAYFWSDSSTSQTITVNAAGVYSVSVSDANGCTSADSISVSFQVCAGVNEITVNFSVSVFPNPNKGVFSVETRHSPSLPVTIEIFNVLGEKIYPSIISYQKSSVIDLKNHGSGVYFIQIKAGEKIAMRRIVVE